MTSDQPLNDALNVAASPAPASTTESPGPSPFDAHEFDQPDLLEQASRDQWAATGDDVPILELPAEEAEAAAAEAAAIEAELTEGQGAEEGGLLSGEMDCVIRAAAESGYDAAGELEKMQRLVSRRWKIKDETQDHYRKIARRLWRETERAARQANPDEPSVVTPIDVAQHLIGEFANRSEGTWRVYRSAVLWSFGEREHVPEYAAALLLIEQYNPGTDAAAGSEETKTSVKALPRADLLALLDMLGSMNRTVQWGVRAQYWLQAGLATGLRPAEWQKATWADEEKTALRVETGKQKADVPAFERRRLEAEGTPREPDQAAAPKVRLVPVALRDRTVVDLHMRAMASSGFPFKDYYEYARQTLWKACQRLWKGKKTYSLYSARHQFSANLKAVLPRSEVSAAMGHSRRKNNLYASQMLAYRRGGGDRPGAAERAEQAETAAMGGQLQAAEPVAPQAGTASAG